MTKAPTRRLADSVELIDTLAYALRYDGKKRVHHADDVMARVTAEYLIRHLEQAGFVLMRKAPGAAPATAIMPSSTG
jgi:hypothetical protein